MKHGSVYFAISTTILLWASAFVGIRYSLHGFTPGALALFRYLVASIAIVFIYSQVPNKQKLTVKDLPFMLMLGIIGIGLYNITLNLGETTVTAGLASFIVGLMPVVTMIMAVMFLGEHVPKAAWLGVVVCLAGMSLIAMDRIQHHINILGLLECFLATICNSVFSIMQKKILGRFKPIEVTAFAIWFGTLFMLPYAPGLMHQLPHATTAAIVVTIYMGIFPGAIAYACWSYTLAHMPASRAVLFLYALPVVSTILGYLLLHEIAQPMALIGAVVAFLGAGITKYLAR